ncbi:MAG: hypothetical protein WBR29_12480 [Gammaproteobacteria bacterium]
MAKTAALEPELINVAISDPLVVVGTSPSWSLNLEINGHLPWQGETRSASQRVRYGENQ